MRKFIYLALILFSFYFTEAQVSPSPFFFPTNADSIIHIVNVNGVPRRVYNIDLQNGTLQKAEHYADSLKGTISVFSGDYNDLSNRPVNRVDYVPDISSLENYIGNAKTVVVQDSLRGGTFNLVSTGVPDSGTIFKSYYGLFWKRSFGGTEVNVRWFGAIGDGVTDETNAIQLAIYSVDVNHGHAGGSVYIPSGIYIISSPIVLGGYVNIHGDYWNSFLKIKNGANCNMFINPTNAPINYLKVYDLEMYGNRSNQTAGSGVSITYNGYNNSDIYFTHVLISNFKDNGIYIENGWQYHIESSIIETFGKYCVKLNPTQQSDPSAASADLRRIFIANSSLLAGDSGAIYANGSSKRWILGLNVNNSHIGPYTERGSTIHIRGVKDFAISNNRIAGAPYSGDTTLDIIRIDSNARIGVINGNTITNLAEYYNTVDAAVRYGISVWDTSNNITLSKNQFFKDLIRQNVYVAPTAYLINTDSTLNDSLMALKQDKLIAGSNISIVGNTISATTGGGSGGLSKVYSGYGLANVNDSTLKADTVNITSKSYLSNALSQYLQKTGGNNLGFFGFGRTFSDHGGYGNYIDIAGGITMQRPSDAAVAYLLAVFDASGSALGNINIPANTHNMLFSTAKTDGYMMFSPGNGVTYNNGNLNPASADSWSLGDATFKWKNIYTDNITTAYAAKSANYTLTSTDRTIEVTATGQTITLPTAVGISGREYVIKLTASGTATVATTFSQTIDGATTYSLSAQYKYVKVQSNGSNWIIIGNN